MKEDISLLQAQLTYKKRLQAMLKELKAQQGPLCKKVAELEQKMLSEKKDVDRLEGRSLTAFFCYIFGTMEEKLDTERREYYAARVKYDAAARELEAIEQDIECTEEDLQDLADCETRYARLIEEKRVAIENAGTALSEELLEKEAALAYLRSQERELEEAIAAGTAALRTVADVVQNLSSAKDWSTFDLLGGKFLADMAKHEKLDEAQKNVEELQVQLQRFNKELSDVTIRSSLQISIDGMLKFADCFFDNLFTDMAVMEHINESRSQVDQTRDLILGILRQLQTRLEEVRHRQIRAKAEVDEMIVSIEV